MFKRFKASIAHPPQTIFFMKDSWWRIIGYILLVPFLLTLPIVLRSFVSSGMTSADYQALISTVQTHFRSDHIQIVDGVLIADEEISASYEYIHLVVGRGKLSQTAINILFDEDSIVMVMTNMEVERISYVDLDLLNHDFSSLNLDDIRTLSFAIRRYIEQQSVIRVMDFMLTYFTGLIDYLFYILMLSLLSMMFITKAHLPMKYRFKLSVYLTTIVIVLGLVTTLFNVNLGFFTFFVGYIYHLWAYRSMKIIEPGGL